jgi:chemotaxis protein MotB
VSAGRYDNAVAEAEMVREQLRQTRTQLRTELSTQHNELKRLRQSMAEAEAYCAATAQELEVSAAGAVTCKQAIDEATALNYQLRDELEKRGQNVNELLSSKGALASSLEQARSRLEELRRAQAAAEQRAAIFREVAVKLKRMVDSGNLQIALRSGRMVLVLSNDVLFDSGKAKIKHAGEESLAQVGAVLAGIAGRRFQVAGHTDDEPIRMSGFASNWELSTQRALEVVGFLIKSGMSPASLSAAGYGEFDPVTPNDSAENKARNRRIEITLQPNIDEFVALPAR